MTQYARKHNTPVEEEMDATQRPIVHPSKVIHEDDSYPRNLILFTHPSDENSHRYKSGHHL